MRHPNYTLQSVSSELAAYMHTYTGYITVLDKGTNSSWSALDIMTLHKNFCRLAYQSTIHHNAPSE